MTILPVHQVEGTQLSLCWTVNNTLVWRVLVPSAEHSGGSTGRGGWHRLPSVPWPAWPGLLGTGCAGALALGPALPQPGPWQGKGTPHPLWGVPSLQCLLLKSQPGLLSGAPDAQAPTQFFIYHRRGRTHSSSHRLLLHLKLNYRFWSFFIEAEVHGQRRKGRKQLT